ncbi:MAG: DUF4342 domain-containing protein [Clostridia bacterium]|nr:DUF4342 domain-containing protein [Clostridia bacterium]MDO5303800.1 DUF4342 domain-containing protein [Clostridia bacterium]
MEITLEKIELVKDRTGVTYKEAKEALEAAEGNVVDAIISIEEEVNEKATAGENLKAKIKEILDKGNVSRVIVSKNGETLLNLPIVVGILGTVIAPTAAIIGVVASFGFKCKIEFVKDDGSVIDLTEKAGVFYEEAKEKAPSAYEDLKEKSVEFYEDLKEKGSDAFYKAKDVAEDVKAKMKKDDDFDIFDVDDDLDGFDGDDEEAADEACDPCESCETPDACDTCDAADDDKSEDIKF